MKVITDFASSALRFNPNALLEQLTAAYPTRAPHDHGHGRVGQARAADRADGREGSGGRGGGGGYGGGGDGGGGGRVRG